MPIFVSMAAVPALPPSALAALSAAVLLLALDHRRENLGGRAALGFLLASIFYGLVRSLSIRALSEARLAGVPYRLGAPLATIVGVPLQELIGWTAAAALSAYFADRLLRRFGQPTDAYRTALLAGLGLAAVCLPVESAAVSGGWWTWSLAHPPGGAIPFPGIALLDWGFVALDFLLPFELWSRRAPLPARLGSLLLFPIHLAGHAWTGPMSPSVPLSGFDLVHLGLVAFAAGAAVVATDRSPWPPIAKEKVRSRPAFAVAILLGTAAIQLLVVGKVAYLWTIVPLGAVTLCVARLRDDPAPRNQPRRLAVGVAVFFAVLLGGAALRLPAALKTRDFERDLRSGAAALASGRNAEALDALARALALRPDSAEALRLAGRAELELEERGLARRHLEAALAARPGSIDAVRLLARLDLEEGKRPEAAALVKEALARHPGRKDLAYLAWKAEDPTFGTAAAPTEILAAATSEELAEIYALARALGDRATEEACRKVAAAERGGR